MKMGVQYQWDAEVLPLDAARYAERLGFESIWMGEHSHIPVRRETPFRGGGEIPEGYKTIPDPFACLEILRLYAEGGIDRVTLTMRPTPNDPTDLERLDRFAELVHQTNEAVGAPVATGTA